MKVVIGLTGVKTSGKSTAFNLLKEEIPNIVEVQLAKKLKDECSRVFKVERSLFDDPARKEVNLETPVYLDAAELTDLIRSYGREPNYDTHIRPHIGVVLESPRRVAQYIGTEVLRTVDEDIHCIGATMNLPKNGIFVVTDMRFVNEYAFMARTYGENFHPFHIQNDRAEFAGAQDMHPSERQVLETAKRCTPIPNNKTIADLKNLLMEEIWSVLDQKPTDDLMAALHG